MQTIYSGEHSVIFGDKHSWEDWGLVPASLPIIAMPEVNENIIEVPGMNGVVDLSDVPLGFPTYKLREGSLEFKIAHDTSERTWSETYSMIASYLHGRRRTCILTDDRSYYYTGRFKISELKSDKMCNTITIDYVLDPFKEMIWTTCGDWEWDPFDFIYGEITQGDFKNIPVSASSTNLIRWDQNQIGAKPVVPTITVNSAGGNGMEFRYANSIQGNTFKSFQLSDGENYNPQIEFACPDPDNFTAISIIGSGTISIDFRPGRL
jgi:hypothetical protein